MINLFQKTAITCAHLVRLYNSWRIKFFPIPSVGRNKADAFSAVHQKIPKPREIICTRKATSHTYYCDRFVGQGRNAKILSVNFCRVRGKKGAERLNSRMLVYQPGRDPPSKDIL